MLLIKQGTKEKALKVCGGRKGLFCHYRETKIRFSSSFDIRSTPVIPEKSGI